MMASRRLGWSNIWHGSRRLDGGAIFDMMVIGDLSNGAYLT
jgi:hypothetical protein